MHYVYVLQSIGSPEQSYVGCTHDLRDRLKRHNAGQVPHTSRFAPWQLRTYTAFSDRGKAFAFEHYLKSGSARAFARKHY